MAKKKKTLKNPVEKNRCGLCGKTRNLTKTECCDHWICDDEDKYVMFSYARNSCHRNPIVTPCAPTITTKNMTAIGNHVLNAGAVSLRKITSGTAPTNAISRRYPIRQHMSRQDAPDAQLSLF